MFASEPGWAPTKDVSVEKDVILTPEGYERLKTQIEAGKYPGIVKTTLDGWDQRAYLEGKSDKFHVGYWFSVYDETQAKALETPAKHAFRRIHESLPK